MTSATDLSPNQSHGPYWDTGYVTYSEPVSLCKTSSKAVRNSPANAQRMAKMGSWDFRSFTQEMKWSEELFCILETDAGEVTPSHEVFLGFVHPDDHEEVDRIYQSAMRNGEPCEIEHRLL